MVSFKINEIPKGKSEETMTLLAEDLEVSESGIKKVYLTLLLNKQDDHIRVQCRFSTEAAFVCDRSLETFDTETHGNYEVVFQYKVIDEREDLSGALKTLDYSHNIIDITKEIRDSILLSIPAKKIHPRYLKDGEITDFSASYGIRDNEPDPRWESLKKLK